MRRRPLLATAVAAILLLAWIAYRLVERKAFIASGALPPPPSGQVTFAGITPEHPFQAAAGNILSHTAFQTSAPSKTQVEVRDFILPPHAKSQLAALPGPALLEVYSGEGTLKFNKKSERLAAGNMRSVAAGEALAIDNAGTLPVVLRLYVFEAK